MKKSQGLNGSYFDELYYLKTLEENCYPPQVMCFFLNHEIEVCEELSLEEAF